MEDQETFEQPYPEHRGQAEELVLQLDGFAGPIDLLLTLAREQRVDLTKISILHLAEQYLAFVQEVRRVRLELAADYLVMAAWLAYLKSKLLLPVEEEDGEEPSGAEMAAALKFQLRRLEAMREAGLEARFVQGRRYTDERTLAIAEDVLVNQVNRQITESITSLGHEAMGLHSLSSCAVFAERLCFDGQKGRKTDIGFVGKVVRVNASLLHTVSQAGCIPVIAPIARDVAGGKLNVNADSVAGHVAAAVRAEKLVLVSDTHGIRKSADADDLASHLTKEQIEDLVDSGVITAGMLPKVQASFMALSAGVNKTHIIDGRIPHSLLLEVYTKKGIGTEIVL